MTRPTPPIELLGERARLDTAAVEIPPAALAELAAACPTTTATPAELAEVSRDWWPLGLHWALAGEVPQRAAVICRPESTAQVSALLALCHRHHLPVTAAGGRSGVCAGAVPLFGGVLADLTGLNGIAHVDETSALVTVRAGTFGPDMEATLVAEHGLSVGHFPQSFELATVGGWVACRGAGQYSTRYGTIADLVAGLEVVLADGTVLRTGGSPRAACGPDLGELFVGSEGCLGVITEVTLRAHPLPPAEQRAAFRFATFAEGLEACRATLRRGATPAVLRLYDAAETQRGHGGDGIWALLVVLDEGDPLLVEATMAIVAETCAAAEPLGAGPVDAWMAQRNDTSALQDVTRKGIVVDTMEIAAPWSALPGIVEAVGAAVGAVEHAVVVSAHLSHSYPDGACLYFTFAALPPPEAVERTYVALWDAAQRAVLGAGGNLSHHHGVGLNRARFVAEALGAGSEVLAALKRTLDPHGVLNPGKLGIPSPFGEVPWP